MGDIFIVDNACEEAIEEMASRYGCIYIANVNTGYGAGHNRALRMTLDAGGIDYHLVLNPDVSFEPSVLDDAIGYMDSHNGVGQLQPRVVYPDGTPQYAARMLPTPVDLLVRRFLPGVMFSNRRDRYLLKHLDLSAPHDVPYHQGSFMLFRCDALREVGLFDERFFMYPEDIDITRRMHRRWTTLYMPSVTVVHRHRAESYRSLRMTWIHIVNMVRYFNKWGWIFDEERDRFNSGLY